VDALPIDRLRAAARGFSDARLVVVFGSAARGQAASWSDLDVGVIGVDFWRGQEIGGILGDIIGREPHVVDLERADTWLRYNVARDGVLLHEASPGVWVAFQAQAMVMWFDLAPIVARCAEGVRRRLAEGR